jgi:glycosyltransferase involved in cell wall biosynthesis
VKTLLVHNHYQMLGGEDEVYHRERKMLVEHGHDVIEYTRDNREIAEYGAANRLTLALRTTWAWDSYHQLCDILAKTKPNIAHFHNTFPLVSPAAYYACRAFEVPVVQTLHNYRLLCPAGTFVRAGQICEDCTEHGLSQSIRHGCYRHSAMGTTVVATMLTMHRQLQTYTRTVRKYIALSGFSRKKFLSSGFPPESVAVKPNFVDPDPGEGMHNGEFAVFVGRLGPEKGLSTLLKAWSQLPKLPLRIIGDGEQRTHLESEAAVRELLDTRFLGFLRHEQVKQHLKAARFLIFPSLCYETFGMTIAEAYACGTPVIASRLGAMQEIVHDGRTGLHFTPGDADDLAKKVEWAWAHPEEMRVMGRNARAEYEAKYTAERNYNMLLAIYQRVIQETQESRAFDTRRGLRVAN